MKADNNLVAEIHMGYYKMYPSDNIFGIPLIHEQPEEFYARPEWNFISWNYARSMKRKDDILHFYLDDDQFSCLLTYSKRESYLPVFRNFRAVCSPDFSLLPGMPHAVGMWQTYKARWISCWLQANGVIVIPAVNWAEPDSFSYCFLGISTDQVVSVQVPKFRFPEEQQNFTAGFREMTVRLSPRQIVFYGEKPGCVETGDIPYLEFPRFKPFRKIRSEAVPESDTNNPLQF